MRKLATIVFGLVAILFITGTTADAGQKCPRNTTCMSEDRSVLKVSTSAKVSVTACISQANWRALNAYWRAKGMTGNCFWWASSKRGDRTNKVYSRCGTITVKSDRAYAYNGRTNWDIFGPWR